MSKGASRSQRLVRLASTISSAHVGTRFCRVTRLWSYTVQLMTLVPVFVRVMYTSCENFALGNCSVSHMLRETTQEPVENYKQTEYHIYLWACNWILDDFCKADDDWTAAWGSLRAHVSEKCLSTLHVTFILRNTLTSRNSYIYIPFLQIQEIDNRNNVTKSKTKS